MKRKQTKAGQTFFARRKNAGRRFSEAQNAVFSSEKKNNGSASVYALLYLLYSRKREVKACKKSVL